MKIIIATDIFGYGEHLEGLRSQLSAACPLITFVSPYVEKQISFRNENEAYECFLAECGHDHFSKLVAAAISNASEEVFLIGFSAGASAIWRAIGSNNFTNVISFIGFYPSQVRNHLGLSAPCPTTIIFPHSEDHFDVVEISKTISSKSMVDCQISDFYHGFMNPLSKHYDSEAESTFTKALSLNIMKHACTCNT